MAYEQTRLQTLLRLVVLLITTGVSRHQLDFARGANNNAFELSLTLL